MAKTARDEGFSEIADWFETLAKAEKSHAGRFAQGRRHALSPTMADVHGLRRPGTFTVFLSARRQWAD